MSSPIWHTPQTLTQINEFGQGTLSALLGIEIIELGPDYIRGTMPADERTFQPMGRIHGGANIVLAETLGSIGAHLLIDSTKYYAVGLEVNANHVRGVSSGIVTGTARPSYQGRTTQVWDIQIEDDRGKISCISRLTVAVVKI